MLNKYFFILTVLLCAFFAQGQSDTSKYVVDDSRFYYEEDLFSNSLDIFNRDSTLRHLDTSITSLHQYEMWYKQGDIAQDLGAIGSPLKPLYYSAPSTLGLTSGYVGFDPYSFKNSEVKYYDTKRPFSNLNVIMGGNGRQYLKVDFGRNIDERASFGLVFRRLTSIDPIGANPAKDPFGNHYSSQVFFNYHTKNQRYYLLTNYRWMNHNLFETGGVKKDSDFNRKDYFDDVAQPNLTNVTSNDRRNNWHIYQQFNVLDSSKTVQLFHVFDRMKQKYQYLDEGLANNIDFYDNIYNDSTLTNDSTTFETITNRGGIKGIVKGVNYSAYALNRSIYHSRNDTVKSSSENYVGGSLGYVLEQYDLRLKADIQEMFNGEYSHLGFNAEAKGAFLNFSRDVYSPTMLSREYSGNHLLWIKEFEAITSSSFEVGYKLNYKNIEITPSYGQDAINDLVYYDNTANPIQEDGQVKTNYLGGKYHLVFNKIGWRGFVKYYSIDSENKVLRAPKLFWHNQLYLKGKLFKGVMDFEAGFDIYYRESYSGFGYAPNTGQFILENEVFKDTWIVDLYFNCKVKNLILFFKINHIKEIGGEGGYLATAGYPGQGWAIGFGANWKLFD